MYRRIAAVVAATAAAVLLAATPAWAEDRWMPAPQPEPTQTSEQFPGTPRPEGLSPLPPGPDAEWLASCIDEPVEEEPGLWTCTLEVPADEGAPEDGPTADPEPEPEPVDIVEDNGDWGWSDAREMYRG